MCDKTIRHVSVYLFAALSMQSALAAGTVNLCRTGEDVLFSCKTGTKAVSICASKGWSSTVGSLQYRFGKSEALDLAIPQVPTNPSLSAVYGQLMFSGGGGAYLRFDAKPYSYIVYTAVSSSWGDKSGVAIEKSGKLIKNINCHGQPVSYLGPDLFNKAGLAADITEFELP